MAFPLIPFMIAIVSGAGAGVGIAAHVDAADNRRAARERAEDANRRRRDALRRHERARRKLECSCAEYNEVAEARALPLLKRLRGKSRRWLGALQDKVGSPAAERTVATRGLAAMDALVGSALGVEAAVGTAIGAKAGVAALATAGTGTPIAQLSGAAASKATMAALGGGAKAAGGLGVAGGSAVLGGAALGIGILVTGLLNASDAERLLTEVHREAADADRQSALIVKEAERLAGVAARVDQAKALLEDGCRVVESALATKRLSRKAAVQLAEQLERLASFGSEGA